MVMEAEKSHYLLSADCITWKATVIQSESKGLRLRAADLSPDLNLKA